MPVLALLGRPNVGKSTLFNQLTRARNALVADFPGLTRDRQYGYANLNGQSFTLIDTAGLIDDAHHIDEKMLKQSFQAAAEADAILFITDAQQGLSAYDELIVDQLRYFDTPVQLIINKIDSLNLDNIIGEFYELGLGDPVGISASQGRGINRLSELLAERFGDGTEQSVTQDDVDRGMTFAVVGRPNVGKSTFINRLLGEERLLAFDQPGTTRDSIFVPFDYGGNRITLVDTAGVRRRGRIRQVVEKFSVIKTLQAIDQANVVIMLLDACEGIADQDASLLGYILERGRALVIGVNKWDHLPADQRKNIKRQLELKLGFVSFADLHFISSRYGSGIFDILDSAQKAYKSAFSRFATSHLNKLLQDILAEYQPPLVRGRRIKLRYINQCGSNPPHFIIHGNLTCSVPEGYRRFLINRMRKYLCLKGTPILIEFRGGDNPFKGRYNKLTKRQLKKRERIREYRRHR